ncbi:MAG: ORF6N domain-containing protein [Planctomycetia bacterium]|nr:ORF6N domain-containing protein [Planctomycetia bacterium]
MSTADNKIVAFDADQIKNLILSIRGLQVMIDRDLAELYNVSTKVMNQAVKRNLQRFPNAFRFQITEHEKYELVTNCDRFQSLKYSSVNPYAFTEQGVAMLSSVLRSETAVKVSIQIMNAFVGMRKFLATNAQIFQRISAIEKRQLKHEIKTDEKFEKVFDALQSKEIKPKQGIFYDGQIFDAYKFVSGLIRQANKSIILIDNYIDEKVLDLFTKKKKNVKITIFTNRITKTILLDVEKFNSQYPILELKQFTDSHDRFLIIDEKIVYHIGASLKDLGKKWFAFSKMKIPVKQILNNLQKAT